MFNNDKMPQKRSITVKRQLFEVNFDSDTHNFNDIVTLSSIKAHEQDDIIDSTVNLSSDNSIYFDSDEDEYDSDCSLDSLESLYLRLKESPKRMRVTNKNMVQSNDNINYPSKTYHKKNIVIKTQTTEKQNVSDKNKNVNSIKKLNAISFYGKQVNVLLYYTF